MANEWLDEDGYPTEKALERIHEWDLHDFLGLMEFVRSIWWHADWGWSEKGARTDLDQNVTRFQISTGGWSGNEDLIVALTKNQLFFLTCFAVHRTGGHWTFEVPDRKP